jgi:hypothetical protein
MLGPGPEKHLRHRQADQLGVGQPFRLTCPGRPGNDHVVVDLHVQCDQEGIQVWSHNRSWMPSSHVHVNPVRHIGPDQESLI